MKYFPVVNVFELYKSLEIIIACKYQCEVNIFENMDKFLLLKIFTWNNNYLQMVIIKKDNFVQNKWIKTKFIINWPNKGLHALTPT